MRLELDPDDVERIAARVADMLAERVTATIPLRPAWMTTKEAAEYLRIAVSEVQRLAAAGAIPCEQDGGPGGRLFFSPGDLDQWRRSGGRRR